MRKFVLVLVCLSLLLSLTGGLAQADLQVSEAALNPTGAAYEINADDQGFLWISDYDAGEIWGVDPATGSYEVYPVGGAPSDARHVGDTLWWADGETDVLGRASTLDGAYTHWRVPGVAGFYGTALDAQGRFWAVDYSGPFLYRLDPALPQLCTIILPDDGMSDYLLRQDGYLWVGDYMNSRLLRLAVSDNSLTWWELPAFSYPFGLAVDGQGDIWYADSDNNMLAQLDPDTSELTSYPFPLVGLPGMVAIQGDRVWFSEQQLTSIGILDPALADHEVAEVTTGSASAVSSCESISTAATGYLTITVGDISGSPALYPTLVNEGGWKIFQMPGSAVPWGIASQDQTIWVVDTGRQNLIQVIQEEQEQKVYLPLIKK